MQPFERSFSTTIVLAEGDTQVHPFMLIPRGLSAMLFCRMGTGETKNSAFFKP